jgi:hypothetical protein
VLYTTLKACHIAYSSCFLYNNNKGGIGGDQDDEHHAHYMNLEINFVTFLFHFLSSCIKLDKQVSINKGFIAGLLHVGGAHGF